ncbi:Uma2 family endonuclease [Streptomyces albidoflavus]|uniref:Uma2 family endonuclease n=1 Tax=Streptomyces albidoflavus TaxID=1886 RepID=UPI0033EC817F
MPLPSPRPHTGSPHPRTGRWTLRDVLALPEDTTHRTELARGRLLTSPRPGLAHQRVSHRLHTLLERSARESGADVEILAAVNVIVPDGLLIPDLVIADAPAAHNADLTLHAHDILTVIEIVSPSTHHADHTRKPTLYATAAIPHYWRLDLPPIPRPHLTIGHRRARTDEDHRHALPTGHIRLNEPFPVDFDPEALVLR